jgi:hypothetical protein
MNPTLQTKAKAYPGVKHLAIAHGMGSQGIAASVCPNQITDATASDYGYRPAMAAIADRLKRALAGQCLPNPLPPDAQGQVSCSILEATKTSQGACSCDAASGRIPVPAADACYQQAAMQDPLYAVDQWNCFCEIPQTTGAALGDCETSTTPGAATDGGCYVSAPTGGNPALVSNCPAGEQQLLRLVGDGKPAPGATVFVVCQ